MLAVGDKLFYRRQLWHKWARKALGFWTDLRVDKVITEITPK
jgi:hypothetical protein